MTHYAALLCFKPKKFRAVLRPQRLAVLSDALFGVAALFVGAAFLLCMPLRLSLCVF